MLGTTRSHRSRPLGTAFSMDAVFPPGTQFGAQFLATVPGGQPIPRGSLPGEATLVDHQVSAVSSTSTTITVEIVDQNFLQYTGSTDGTAGKNWGSGGGCGTGTSALLIGLSLVGLGFFPRRRRQQR